VLVSHQFEGINSTCWLLVSATSSLLALRLKRSIAKSVNGMGNGIADCVLRQLMLLVTAL
jgi:hypothetical protein